MQPEGDFIRNSKVKVKSVKSSRNKMEETDIEEMEKKIRNVPSHCNRQSKGHEGSTGQKRKLGVLKR